MKDLFRKKENKILAFLILNAFLFLSLFFYDLNKRIDISERTIIGSVEFKKNIIQRKFDDHMVWESLSKNSPITNRDTIRSDSYSDAIIRLNDGTEISMDENSMFYLDISGDDPTLDFSSGNINVKKLGASSDQLKIKSNESMIIVSKGELNINQTQNGNLTMHVDKGKASISSNGVSHTVESGNQANVKNNKVEITKTPFILISPVNNQILTTKEEDKQVEFQWEPVEKYSTVSLEISRYFRFNTIFKKIDSPSQSLAINLPIGSYYWRLRSNDKLSPQYRFHVYNETNVNSKLPLDDVILTFVEKLPSISFYWNKDPLAKDYILEISDSKKFQSLSSRHTTKTNSMAVDNLDTGEYFWRVKTVPISPDLPEKTSSVKTFKIQKTTEFSLPKLVKQKLEAYSSEDYPKTGIHIWESSNELIRFQFQMAEDPKFDKLIIDKETNHNFYQPNKRLDTGTYYWRVKGYSASGKSSKYTEPGKFRIVSPEEWEREKLISLNSSKDSPSNELKQEIKTIPLQKYPVDTVVDLSGKSSLNFNWNREGRDSVYIISIYNEEDGLKKPVHQIKTKESSYTMTNLSLLDEGKFSWEILVISGSKQIKKESAKFILSVTKLRKLKPEDIEFISPSVIYKDSAK
jgi:hypothetical protein